MMVSAVADPVVEQVLQFARMLRRRGLKITISDTLTVLAGLAHIDPLEKRQFYYLLRASFCSSPEERIVFDTLFDHFWGVGELALGSTRAAGDDEEIEDAVNQEADQKGEGDGQLDSDAEEKSQEEPGADMQPQGEDDKSKHGEPVQSQSPPIGLVRPDEEPAESGGASHGYSPKEFLIEKDFRHLSDDEAAAMRRAVRNLAGSLLLGMQKSRRTKRGMGHLDFRKLYRSNMRYAGEIIELRRRTREENRLDLVVLCDVSGSMDVYMEFYLLFLYVLQNSLRNVETFVFSTHLTRVTSSMRKSYAKAKEELARKARHWSGGTKLGASLKQFNAAYQGRLSAHSTSVIIISDGWDRGDTSLISQQLKQLRKHVRQIIWLNPLLGTPNYQPVAKGLQAALPHVDYFLPANSVKSLLHAAKILARPGKGQDVKKYIVSEGNSEVSAN